MQVGHIPVEAASHGPDFCWTKEIPQFIDTVADFPVVRIAVEKTFVLPQLQIAEKNVVSSLWFADHGTSSVAVH